MNTKKSLVWFFSACFIFSCAWLSTTYDKGGRAPALYDMEYKKQEFRDRSEKHQLLIL